MNSLPLQPGDRVAGRYLLLAALGEGGMAVVFEALDEELQRRVALKVLRRMTDISAARFEREARAANAIRHPAVVPVFAVGRLADGRPYLALELIDGEPLNELVARVGPLPPERALHLLLPAIGALAEAHEAGIVHRDLKPSNLIVQHAPGQVEMLRLLDFGIAAWDEPDRRRLTKTGEVFGTPEFMSPEQAMSRPVSAATDVWAIGVVLYELLSGNVPFQGNNAPSVLFKVVNEAPPPLPASVPPEVAALVEACLQKRPANRPADAGVLLAHIEALLLPPRRELASSRPDLPQRPSGAGVITAPAWAPTHDPPKAPEPEVEVVTLAPMPEVVGAPPAMPTQPSLRRRPTRVLVASGVVVAVALGALWGLGRLGPKTGTATGLASEAPAAGAAAPGSEAPGSEAVAGVMAPVSKAPASEAPASEAVAPATEAVAAAVAPASEASAPEAPASEAPASEAPEAPASEAPASEAPAAPASEVARSPEPDALEPARALLARGDSKGALSWLARNPRLGERADRLYLEILARLARNDLRSLGKLIDTLLTLDAGRVDAGMQARLLEGLTEQRYWSSLVPALADKRLYPSLHERLLEMTKSPRRSTRARATEVMQRAERAQRPSAPRAEAPRTEAPRAEAPKTDARAARVASIKATLAREKDCYDRKNLIETLGRLGHPSALPVLYAERKRGVFLNLCMGHAIDDAIEAIKKR